MIYSECKEVHPIGKQNNIAITHLTALLYDGLPTAGKTEFVSDIAGALDKVGVLQLPVTICTFQQRTSGALVTPIA